MDGWIVGFFIDWENRICRIYCIYFTYDYFIFWGRPSIFCSDTIVRALLFHLIFVAIVELPDGLQKN